jgi:hypothetical protein
LVLAAARVDEAGVPRPRGRPVTCVFDRPPQADLTGVRLGELERTLLMAAPSLGTLGGLLIQAPEGTRSAQHGYLRAARKLEHLLLLDCLRVQQAVRAHDPRRERPVYQGGSFWRRADPTRRQIVWRVVAWVTPWGEGIRMVYERELCNRLPIRWTKERLRRARRYAATQWRNPEDQNAAVAELRWRLLEPLEEAEERLDEARPDDVRTPEELERWKLAIAVARSAHPGLGSSGLWEAACRIYRSRRSLATLRRQAQAGRTPASDRPALRFHRTDLGLIIPTDAEVRHRLLRRHVTSEKQKSY